MQQVSNTQIIYAVMLTYRSYHFIFTVNFLSSSVMTNICANKQKCFVTSTYSTGPRPGPGPHPLWTNITSVRSWNMFWTGLSPCVAFARLFLLII